MLFFEPIQVTHDVLLEYSNIEHVKWCVLWFGSLYCLL